MQLSDWICMKHRWTHPHVTNPPGGLHSTCTHPRHVPLGLVVKETTGHSGIPLPASLSWKKQKEGGECLVDLFRCYSSSNSPEEGKVEIVGRSARWLRSHTMALAPNATWHPDKPNTKLPGSFPATHAAGNSTLICNVWVCLKVGKNNPRAPKNWDWLPQEIGTCLQSHKVLLCGRVWLLWNEAQAHTWLLG